MIYIKCAIDNIYFLPKKLQRFAFGQDKSGKLELTVDKKYVIYGFLEHKDYSQYLILRDDHKLPWWMPVDLFWALSENDNKQLKRLPHKKYGLLFKQNVWAPNEYFGNEADIEDGTRAGYKAFETMYQNIDKYFSKR